jgi:hypothetical protein
VEDHRMMMEIPHGEILMMIWMTMMMKKDLMLRTEFSFVCLKLSITLHAIPERTP